MIARLAEAGVPPRIASILGLSICVALVVSTESAPLDQFPNREVIAFLDAASEAELRVVAPLYSIAINLTFDLGVANMRSPSLAGQQAYERLRAWRQPIERRWSSETRHGGGAHRGNISAACKLNALAKDCM